MGRLKERAHLAAAAHSRSTSIASAQAGLSSVTPEKRDQQGPGPGAHMTRAAVCPPRSPFAPTRPPRALDTAAGRPAGPFLGAGSATCRDRVRFLRQNATRTLDCTEKPTEPSRIAADTIRTAATVRASRGRNAEGLPPASWAA